VSEGPPDQIAARRIYTGRVLNLDVDTVRFPDGSEGQLEMIRHPGAAAVVPLLTSPDAADPQVLLIHQYRYAAGGKIWEVPAGRLDPGESPEACARRELLEEAGLEASHLERLTTIHTTPGFTDERIHLFAAWDLKTGSSRPESDEFLEAAPHQVSRVLEMIRVGEITDAKTVVALLYFAGFRLGL
jgi:ADP-ribose pyrophosphatase